MDRCLYHARGRVLVILFVLFEGSLAFCGAVLVAGVYIRRNGLTLAQNTAEWSYRSHLEYKQGLVRISSSQRLSRLFRGLVDWSPLSPEQL